MHLRGHSPGATWYRGSAIVDPRLPTHPDLLHQSAVAFNPDLPPAAFPSLDAPGNNPPDPSHKPSKLIVLHYRHNKKRKREASSPAPLSSSMSTFEEEIDAQGFTYFVDWNASNGLDNLIWRKNIRGLTENEFMPFNETDSQPAEDDGCRETTSEFISRETTPEMQGIVMDDGERFPQTTENVQSSEISWNQLSPSIQIEIVSNVAERYNSFETSRLLGLTKEDYKHVEELAVQYNGQSVAEDDALKMMQQDQLNAILRTDHSTGLSWITQDMFGDITRRHLTWVHGGTQGEFNVCTQEELEIGSQYLRQQKLDPALVGVWELPEAYVKGKDTRSAHEPTQLLSESLSPERDHRRGSIDLDSGYITTDSNVTSTTANNILRLRLKAPKQPPRQRSGTPGLHPIDLREKVSSSPLKNEFALTEASTSDKAPAIQKHKSPRISNKSLQGESTLVQRTPKKKTTTSSRKKSSPPQTVAEGVEDRPKPASFPRPTTPTDARSSSPITGSSGATRSLRARNELKPTRAALEMEETGLILQRRGGELFEEDSHESDDAPRSDEIEKDRTRKVSLKIDDTGLARVRQAKAYEQPNSMRKKNIFNLGLFTGLSNKISPGQPQSSRTAPLVPPKDPVRRQVVGWNPPHKLPSTFPKSAPLNDFTLSLLSLTKQNIKLDTRLSSPQKQEGNPFSGAPEWSPISEQCSPKSSPALYRVSHPSVGCQHGNPCNGNSSPQFAAYVDNVPNVPDPGSPLLYRKKSVAHLLTPSTSPALQGMQHEVSVYSPSEDSQSSSHTPWKKSKDTVDSRKPWPTDINTRTGGSHVRLKLSTPQKKSRPDVVNPLESPDRAKSHINSVVQAESEEALPIGEPEDQIAMGQMMTSVSTKDASVKRQSSDKEVPIVKVVVDKPAPSNPETPVKTKAKKTHSKKAAGSSTKSAGVQKSAGSTTPATAATPTSEKIKHKRGPRGPYKKTLEKLKANETLTTDRKDCKG